MKSMSLTLKDPSKEAFLLELLASFDYVEVSNFSDKPEDIESEKAYDFFDSVGIWKDRDIDADQLRKDACRPHPRPLSVGEG